jgi:hypothetical protein
MQLADCRASATSCAHQLVRRTCLLALSTLAIGCDSTGPTQGVTGVWGGRVSGRQPNDSLTIFLTQNGSQVSGWGFMRDATNPAYVYAALGAVGTLSGGSLDLTLGVEPGSPPSYHLRGAAATGHIESRFTFGPVFGAAADTATRFSSTLRRVSPPAELAGTWAFTSVTGNIGTEQLIDTIVVSADGRARRHREDVYGTNAFRKYSLPAMWSRRGNWVVFDYLDIPTDSLLIQAGEWAYTTPTFTGTGPTYHYTRVSRSLDLTPPSLF